MTKRLRGNAGPLSFFRGIHTSLDGKDGDSMNTKVGKVICFLALFAVWKIVRFFASISWELEWLIWICTHYKELDGMIRVNSIRPLSIDYDVEKLAKKVRSMPSERILIKWRDRVIRTAEWAGVTLTFR